MGRVFYVNVYEGRRGGWFYGMAVDSRLMSETLAESWLRWIGQRGRRHVCRVKVTMK